jgi:hypothetical protein
MTIPDALSRAMVGLIDEDVGCSWSSKEQVQIIQDCHHELGHAHWKTVYQALKPRVHWKGLRQLTWRTVLGCTQCLRHNPPSKKVGGQQQPINSQRKGQFLVVDIVGPMLPDRYGRRFAFVAVDHYTRFGMVRMLKHPTGAAAVSILRDLFSQLGKLEWVVSDPGVQFKSFKFQKFSQTESDLPTPGITPKLQIHRRGGAFGKDVENNCSQVCGHQSLCCSPHLFSTTVQRHHPLCSWNFPFPPLRGAPSNSTSGQGSELFPATA